MNQHDNTPEKKSSLPLKRILKYSKQNTFVSKMYCKPNGQHFYLCTNTLTTSYSWYGLCTQWNVALSTLQCLNPELAKHETAQQWKISYLTHTSSTDYLREMAHINQQN